MSNIDAPLEDLTDWQAREQVEHREFLLRHIETLVAVLTGEQRQRQWSVPVGCPGASPERLARSRSGGDETFPCCYDEIDIPTVTTEQGDSRSNHACVCGDPLHGSDDPLDAVAATVISRGTASSDWYFARAEREIVAALRSQIGSWDDIATAPLSELEQVSRDAHGARIIDVETAEQLQAALEAVRDHRYTAEESITLTELPSVRYDNLAAMLTSLPGIDQEAAWWLLLTAFDKPVWPASEQLDALLINLGLLSPGTTPENGRHTTLEDALSDRQIARLHRALAGHVRYCDGDHTTAACELRQFSLSYRLRQQAMADAEERPTIVDLFCGAGGLSLGFTRDVGSPKFDVALAVDNDQDATDTYRLNHPEVPHRLVRCEDIGDIAANPEELETLIPDVDVVVGGPPCQALSVAGYRSRRATDDSYSVLEDPRTGLYKHYVSLLETLKPRYIIMENVEGIRSPLGDDGRKVIDEVQAALSEAGYVTDHRLLDCSTFGIPQRRDRVVLFGTREDVAPDPEGHVDEFFEDLYPTDSAEVTIKQALANLPRLRRGEGGRVVGGRWPGRASDYLRENHLNDGTRLTYNHQAREHPMEKDRKLFSEVMEPGDTGWDVKFGTEYGHLIEYNVGTEDNPAFKDKYRMLHWDRPSPTIVAHLAKDGNSFILPDYYEYVQPDEARRDARRSRGITPREAARIQSFPDSYVFLGAFTSQFRQIGNAVPPLLGERIASVLSAYLTQERPSAVEQVSPVPANSDD